MDTLDGLDWLQSNGLTRFFPLFFLLE